MGFFQRCQQFLSFKGGAEANVGDPGSGDEIDDEEGANCREPSFFRSYQKVSTDDRSLAKYIKK